ncbi:hypothetical protein OIU74_023135 [Salix koriyanagi]|uniref:Uncharacterized protein n=1 Tax=Salix koriyanagi TaxID=2511006 RepID=A0A9Q0WBG0_9ROSI|nr:hypothetical protein OIU74_023135 [Salix koriyanagi]
MSTIPNCPDQWNSSRSSPEESDNKNHASRNNNMVALACSNCHLLVILSFLPQLQVSPLFPSPSIATEKSLPRQIWTRRFGGDGSGFFGSGYLRRKSKRILAMEAMISGRRDI